MKSIGILVLAIVFSFLLVGASYAHPGRTDAYGCHTCRTNCTKWGLSTGEYHCHNAKALPQPEEPVTSHYSETGGYTEPAPEYKKPITATKVEVKPEPIPKSKPEPQVKGAIETTPTPVQYTNPIAQETVTPTEDDGSFAVLGAAAVGGTLYGLKKLFSKKNSPK